MLQSLFSLIVLAEVSILGQTLWRQQTSIKWALIAHNLCCSLSSQCKSTAYSLQMPDLSRAFLAPYQRKPHNEECLEEIFDSELKELWRVWAFLLSLSVYWDFKAAHSCLYPQAKQELYTSGTLFSFLRQTLLMLQHLEKCSSTREKNTKKQQTVESLLLKKCLQCHFPSTSVCSVYDVHVYLFHY